MTIHCVGFTGTRVGMAEAQKTTFCQLILATSPVEFRVGDCIGADANSYDLILRTAWSQRWWTRPRLIGHPPTDDRQRAFLKYDEEMPPEPFRDRDQHIVRRSDLLIATPRSFMEELRSGTWATARDAYRAGKCVIIIWPSGQIDDVWQPFPNDLCPQCGASYNELLNDKKHACFRRDGALSGLIRSTYSPFRFQYIKQGGS